MGREYKPIKLLTGDWLYKIYQSVAHDGDGGKWEDLSLQIQGEWDEMAKRCVTVVTEHLAGMLVEYLQIAQREGDDYYNR